VHVTELEGPEHLRDLAAEMLRAIKATFPVSQPGLITALALMLRSELDRGGIDRDYGRQMFAELMLLEVPEPMPIDFAEQAKPAGKQ